MGGWATFLKIVKYASAVATGYEVKSFWDDEPDEKAIAKYVGEIKGIGDQKIAESIENGLDIISHIVLQCKKPSENKQQLSKQINRFDHRFSSIY